MPFSSLPLALSAAPLFPFPLGSHRPLVSGAPGLLSVDAVPGSSGVALAPAVPVRPLASVSAPSLFCPFASDSSSSLAVSLASPPPASSGLPSFSASTFAYPGSSAPPDLSAAFAFGHPDDLPEDSPPDAIPQELDPVVPAVVPESACS